MTRDHTAQLLGPGRLANRINEIWHIEEQRRDEHDRQKRRELENEIRRKAHQLWNTVKVRESEVWGPASVRSAAIYMALKRAPVSDPIAPDAFRAHWRDYVVNTAKSESAESLTSALEVLGLSTLYDSVAIPSLPDMQTLPYASFAIQFTFKLRKPYLSKDEQDFYIIDNPVRKDKVFGLPYVAPTQWKGALRAAIRQAKGVCDEDPLILRLFGPTRGDDTGKAGRLHFYPTFFDRIGLEIINPHNRERRVGTIPILLECVPKDTQGTFTVLYVPFDRIGKDKEETEQQVAEDLVLVAEGLQAMFTEYGFGAKTSSGFGVANPEVSGAFKVNAPGVAIGEQANEQEEVLKEPQVPEIVQGFWRDYPGEQFLDKPRGWRRKHPRAGSRPQQPEEPEPQEQRIIEQKFEDFAELVSKATDVSKQLLGEGGEA